MSKRTIFTTITALPAGITRDTVLETLHNHTEMIDLNPLVIERHPIKAPRKATPEEYHSIWYHVVDKINYFPGYQGRTEFDVCFHDLKIGLQTHVYAPLGLDIKDKWTLGGTLPHEPKEPVEMGIGVPKEGLWLREDVDMKCNIIATSFVKRTLKKAHATLVERLVEKAHLVETDLHNNRLEEQSSVLSYYSDPKSSGLASPVLSPGFVPQDSQDPIAYPNSMSAYQNIDHSGSNETPPYPYNPPMPTKSRYSLPPPDPRHSQPLEDPRYPHPRHSQSRADPRYSHPRYSQQPPHTQAPRHSYQTQAHPPELAPSEPRLAELDSAPAPPRGK
ncbi:MAG: hypothetical protein Q9212_003757 [Teloschistes hypoglaucus]